MTGYDISPGYISRVMWNGWFCTVFYEKLYQRELEGTEG